ncbi:MAG: alpha/beta hydrolase [Actinomycetota bacterium]|nr:alpha/beta hydrolase [Actinomycetota bacterium]
MGMFEQVIGDLHQGMRMGMAWSRAYASYRLWLHRARPPGGAGRCEADDIDVYYLSYGRGEPVLMLHGGFMFAETWAAQIPALARGYQAVATDARGHGRTTLGSLPITYRQLAEDASAFIEHLGLGPVHLIGWSDGGCAGLAMAIERPDLVRSMVLLGTPFNTHNYTPEAKRGLERILRPRSLSMLGLRALRRVMTPEPEKGLQFVAEMSKMWLNLPDFTLYDLRRIEAPTLVIGCDRDEYLSLTEDPLEIFKQTANAIPRAKLATVKGGTHSVSIERPGPVNRLIQDFLSGN